MPKLQMTANNQCAGGCVFRGTWTALGQHQPHEIQQGETWSPVLGVTDFRSPFPSIFLCFFLPNFPCYCSLNVAQDLYSPTGSSLLSTVSLIALQALVPLKGKVIQALWTLTGSFQGSAQQSIEQPHILLKADSVFSKRLNWRPLRSVLT